MKQMKDSGIEWIGECPKHWKAMPSKFLMKKLKLIQPIYSGEDILSLTINGVIKRDLENPSGKMPTSFDGYQIVYPNNLLMCLFDIDVTPRCVGIIKDYGLTSPAYSQFVLNERANTRYYYYYYLNLDYTKELLHLAKNQRHSLNEEQFGAIPTIVPPIDEQRKIAEYLDKKCEEVDGLIADIQTQIDTLEQYKRSAITEAVTKGTGIFPKFVDGEIQLSGAIPSGWAIVKFKAICEHKSEVNSGDRELLSVYLDRGVIRYSDSTNMQVHKPSESLDKYQNVDIGDFVMNNQQAWRGSVGVSKYKGIISPAYHIFSLSKACNPNYMNYLFRDNFMVQQYEFCSRGVGSIQRNIYVPWLKNCLVLLPPIGEQKSISEYLDKKCAEIDACIEEKKQQISVLETYKKSIIFEYVTGKKEVV